MPIKPEHRAFYRSAEWKSARERVLDRAGDRCERCGVENEAIGYRKPDGTFVDLPGMEAEVAALDGVKTVQIVLTIAHLDEGKTGETVGDDRLQALCQKCHCSLDGKMHARSSAHTRHEKRNGGSALPLE